ncbi:MAG TPA: FkbM family methyltransferase [Candidatus Binatia bacterium]
MLFFHWLDVTWELPFGLRARLASHSEWVVYDEIFVHGEYDRALGLALDVAAGHDLPIHIVDIGSHVGLFTLRATQQVLERGMGNRQFKITAVEGNAVLVKEFQARIFGDNGLSRNVALTHGLVGRRTGQAYLNGDSLFRREEPAVMVPFVDLSALLAGAPQIDLLKCDIEGAELLLLENYPDLLRKVNVAVFELHANLCDTRRCRELLREYGFAHGETLRRGDPYSLYCAWR